VEDVAVPVGSLIDVLEEYDPPAPIAPALSPILERSEPDAVLCPKEIAPTPAAPPQSFRSQSQPVETTTDISPPPLKAHPFPHAQSPSLPLPSLTPFQPQGVSGASISPARASPSRDSGYVRQIGLPDKDKQCMDRQQGVATTHTSARRRHHGMSSFLPFLFCPSPSRYRLLSLPIVPSSAASSHITPPSPPHLHLILSTAL
jgi:hypothetical protein